LRARSFFFFAAANPAIQNGGFLAESKKDIYAIMPPSLYPATIHFRPGDDPEKIITTLASAGFVYPLVGKPDIGGRGRGVKVLQTPEDVRAYVQTAFVDFHIQKFVSLPLEAGIFYYRIPGEEKGRISGIVRKEFLTVMGNGSHTMEELLLQDDRALLQINSLRAMYGSRLQEVPADGEKRVVVPYGNHARGAKFLDDSHLADEQLNETIDHICRQIKDFYFGRLDIRFNSWEELRQGKNYCVIEVNGAGSEPTHIYDPAHSLLYAWSEIIRHWKLLFRISRINHRQGHRYLTVKEGLAMFREDSKNSEMLARMPE